MLGMPTLMPRGFARSRPQTKQQNRGSSHVSDSSSRPGPCRPPLLALLCNSRGWPAAPQREAFILGHKAHQIQLFWKGWAVFPAPKGYSHALNPAVILLPPVFSLWCLFLSFGGGRSLTCHPLVERHVTRVFSLSVLLHEWTIRLSSSYTCSSSGRRGPCRCSRCLTRLFLNAHAAFLPDLSGPAWAPRDLLSSGAVRKQTCRLRVFRCIVKSAT